MGKAIGEVHEGEATMDWMEQERERGITTTPEEYMGGIIGDLNSRRGMIDNIGDRGNVKLIQSSVPLSEMFSYIGNLRSLSKGRATFSMEFGKYQQLPDNLAQDLMGAASGKK